MGPVTHGVWRKLPHDPGAEPEVISHLVKRKDQRKGRPIRSKTDLSRPCVTDVNRGLLTRLPG